MATPIEAPQLPFHESFILQEGLTSDQLYFSDEHPELAIRINKLYRAGPDTLLKNASRTVLEFTTLTDEHGIYTVNPRPVALQGGVAYVCDRMHGNSLDIEIEAGNQEAIDAYAEVLLKLTDYYTSNIDNPDMSYLSNIVGPEQYSWHEGRAVLHDILEVDTRYNSRETNIEISLSAMAEIAYDVLTVGVDFSDATLKSKIVDNLLKYIDTVEAFVKPGDKNFILLRLATYCGENTELREAIIDAHKAEIFYD